MATSKRETAIKALADRLLLTEAEVWRGTDLNRAIPPQGLITVLEGDATSEIVVSPLQYVVDQQVEVVIGVTADDEAKRDAELDRLLVHATELLTSDRQLGGATIALMLGEPSFEAMEADGAAKMARLPVNLTFVATGAPSA